MSAIAFADDENLQRILAAIRAETEPERVYLFGSRARGEHDAESDYDLLVVTDDRRGSRAVQLGVRRRMSLSGIAFDLFVTTPGAFEAWVGVPNTLPYVAAASGRLVHG